ncbi:hypothetical protein AWB64_05616 [Caballeronia sordidicola]|uniref:Uncharacterized protein n=1 Tax=Caballeronia sordidicola TaxID=196367 RepID=A0A158I6L0_CABSO|nr:hypothetical protein AWB64_05616 [Caballeronia sordidicola]
MKSASARPVQQRDAALLRGVATRGMAASWESIG